MFKNSTLLIIFFLFNYLTAFSTEIYTVKSPDEKLVVNVLTTNNLHYQVLYEGKLITTYSPISLLLEDGRELGKKLKVNSTRIKNVNEQIINKGGIRKLIKDNYSELTLHFEGNYQVIFRAYNDGMAYRIKTDFKSPYKVIKETVRYKFKENQPLNAHVIGTYRSSFEKHFTHHTINNLDTEKDLISLPLMVDHQEGLSILLTESDQSGYPGLLFKKYGEENIYAIEGDFAPYPKRTVAGGIKNFNQIVQETENFIAKMPGKSSLPWRLMIIEEKEIGLVDNTLVYQLAKKTNANTDWIKYGKVAWDWYNALNLEGVPFESGLNTDTYKYYIDFASKNNIEYVILDEGWSDQFDIQVLNDAIELKELIAYGKDKGVEIILWSIWYPLEGQMDQLFKWVKDLGVAGLKIDFFDRNDQEVMIAIEKILKTAEKYELLIDLHGCATLAGMERTYPHLLTYESVKGNEFVKWDPDGEPPVHNVSLAYTRNVVGPMDYTPGAMRNATKKGFNPNFESPMSNSTRAHQLGMYMVYFSPLQMMCDAPTAYEKDQKTLDFIKDIPTTWDETIVLGGNYPNYIFLARKKGENWYIGGLNDENERELTLDFSFLDSGNYKIELVIDGINANRIASDYQNVKLSIKKGESIQITMKNGGGFAAKVTKLDL